MIIELPNVVSKEDIAFIKEAVKPFIRSEISTVYNRDGTTVNITDTPELTNVDNFLSKLFSNISENIVQQRFRPTKEGGSGDSGYEYHLYKPGEICHYHSDGETSNASVETLLRYASVTLHLNTVNEGGELVFPAQNKKVKTEEGKVVIFPPYGMFSHYTTPSQEPREVIVTWFLYTNFVVRRK
jgi:hypothetical protein